MSITSFINKLTTLNIMSSPSFETSEGQYETGLAQGREHFWDAYQCMGGRTDYGDAFQGSGWNENTFKPKYPITLESYIGGIWNYSKIKDLSKCIDAIYADNARDNLAWFEYSDIERVPTIYMRKTRVIGALFKNAQKLRIIDCIVSADYTDKKQYLWTNLFEGCENLEEIRWSGHISDNLYMKDCIKLSHDSLISTFEALIPNPESGHNVVQISESANSRLTAEEVAIATNKGWVVDVYTYSPGFQWD